MHLDSIHKNTEDINIFVLLFVKKKKIKKKHMTESFNKMFWKFNWTVIDLKAQIKSHLMLERSVTTVVQTFPKNRWTYIQE